MKDKDIRRVINLRICISKYEYEDLMVVISKAIKQDNLIKKVAGKALQHSKEKHVLDLANNFIINTALCSYIESYCNANLQIHKLELSRENDNLILSVVINDYNFGRLLEVIISKLEKSKKETMDLLIVPMMKVLNGTLSEEQKETILLNTINDCQKGIIRVLESAARKKGMELEIAELSCYKEENTEEL